MARLFLPSGTNYATNPSFEVDTNSDGMSDGLSQFTSPQGSTIYSRVAGRTGGYAQRLQYTGVAADSAAQIGLAVAPSTELGSFAEGDIVTFSFYIKGVLSGVDFIPRIYWRKNDDSGIATVGGNSITPSTDWTRISFTTTAAPALTSRLWAALFLYSIVENDTIDITFDDVLVEKSSVLTPYFDGSTTDSLNASTYAWTGTANASTSTRAASHLRFSGISLFESTDYGTIAARITPIFALNDNIQHVLSKLRTSGDSSRVTISKGSGNTWGITFTDGTDSVSIDSAGVTGGLGVANSLVGRWDANATLDLMWGGSAAGQVACANTDAVATTKLWINPDGDIATPMHAYLGPIIMSRTRKPDAWVTAVDAYLRGSSISIDYIKKTFMAPGDILFTGRQSDGSNIYVKGS